MKVTIMKEFRDKYTGTLYQVGEVVELPEKRVEEIKKKDHTLISEASEAPQRDDNTEGEEDTDKDAEEVPMKRRRTRRGAEEVPEEKKEETVEEQEEPEEEEIPFLPDHYYYIPAERNVVKVAEGEEVPAEWKEIEENVFRKVVSMVAKGEDIGILFGDEKKPEEEEKPTRRRRTRKVREQ